MPTHLQRSRFPVSADALFAWHERPGAFERLVPPWSPVRVVSHEGGIRDGARVVLNVPVGPVSTRWEVEHRDYVAGRQFRDVQRRGPFASWVHTHLFEPEGDAACTLEDRVDWALPLGPLGALFGGWLARRELRRVFTYRHAVTAADIDRHQQFAARGPLTIAVTGATGLVGSQLVPFLTTGGHTVRRLVRDRARMQPGDIFWDPARGVLDPADLAGVDAVIHLAGEPVSERWTKSHKRAIRDSRVQGTGLLARAIAAMPRPPQVLVSCSAVGIYGDGGDRELDERAPAGEGFLAEVAQEWESAADPARAAGVRVVHPRLGVVMSARGGALARLLPPFLAGGGGKIGDGEQWMSWISLDDCIAALHFLVFADALDGPVNLTAPAPVTNAGFSTTLAHVVHRPAIVTVPAFALRLMFGEMADAMLLRGQRVVPSRLLEAGFRFGHPGLEAALRHELGREQGGR